MYFCLTPQAPSGAFAVVPANCFPLPASLYGALLNSTMCVRLHCNVICCLWDLDAVPYGLCYRICHMAKQFLLA